MKPATISHPRYSFFVDDSPLSIYQAWNLAQSLIDHCSEDASLIHVTLHPDVGERACNLFQEKGYEVRRAILLPPHYKSFKFSEIEAIQDMNFDCLILLNTNTIAVSDIRPILSDRAIAGVKAKNRPEAVLVQVLSEACMPLCAAQGSLPWFEDYIYSIPKRYCKNLSWQWKRWTKWIFDNENLLNRCEIDLNDMGLVTQLTFFLAVNAIKAPLVTAPKNACYQTRCEHDIGDDTKIALLRYAEFEASGYLEPYYPTSQDRRIVELANRQIGKSFDNRVFWDLRYRCFPERGSGAGSRGDNLIYKRQLLKEQGVECASSVLDVGCGDLEVLKTLNINCYTGVDQSFECLTLARQARPDWAFRLPPIDELPPSEMVLCMEVVIHQETPRAYRKLIQSLADKTMKTLIISGFEAEDAAIRCNQRLFFYEPLEESLRRTKRFKSIARIGSHPGVVIYRCDVV
jgi:hypothetical protein